MQKRCIFSAISSRVDLKLAGDLRVGTGNSVATGQKSLLQGCNALRQSWTDAAGQGGEKGEGKKRREKKEKQGKKGRREQKEKEKNERGKTFSASKEISAMMNCCYFVLIQIDCGRR